MKTKKASKDYAQEYDLSNQSSSNLFLFAVYYTIHVLGKDSATLYDVRDFYQEHGLSVPLNFGGQIRQLLKKPKMIIKRTHDFTLTEHAKRWIKDYLSLDHTATSSSSKKAYLGKKVGKIDVNKLVLTPELKIVIEERLVEIQKCYEASAPLAVIFLCGSTLEGLLLSHAKRHPSVVNRANAAPKDRMTGVVLPLNEWKLSSLIDVAKEIHLIDEDTSKFSSSVREFRNYVHPNQQATKGFSPTMATAQMCFQVLQMAIVQLEGK